MENATASSVRKTAKLNNDCNSSFENSKDTAEEIGDIDDVLFDL